MILGTHNSGTGGELLTWLKPLAWVINPFSKCQDRSITEQLEDGVRLFNLQVAFVGGKWRFSHGLALYKEDVYETLTMMKAYATKEEPIYFQLYLDKCFWCKQDIEEFEFLIEQLKKICDEKLIMLCAWVEGTDYSPYKSGKKISATEHYWSLGWVKSAKPKCLLDRLPLPRYHAKRYNAKYKENNKAKYLMLDYYNYG